MPSALAQPLDVGDQVPGGVLRQLGVGRALAAAPLVEERAVLRGRVEEPAVFGFRPAARATVEEDDRLPLGVAPLLEVDGVEVRDLEPSSNGSIGG